MRRASIEKRWERKEKACLKTLKMRKTPYQPSQCVVSASNFAALSDIFAI